MENNQDPVQNILLELRRGVIAIAVLSQLIEEQYGYSLLKLLSEQGLEVDQGTLYPLMRRLEAQGLLQSDWRIVEDARPRRYYVLSPEGINAVNQLTVEWNGIVSTLQNMLSNQTK